jgi:hypothetical protein
MRTYKNMKCQNMNGFLYEHCDWHLNFNNLKVIEGTQMALGTEITLCRTVYN